MKNKILMATTLTTLVSVLSGCGGEGGNIYLDPNEGVTASTSCKTSNDNCQGFYLVYPVSGLNFDCSSNKNNHFVTVKGGNSVTGACQLGDTITFSIKGQTTDKQINLGSLDLKTISPIKVGDQPLSLIDIATAMTGKAPTTLNLQDDTIKVATALVRVFQAVGIQEDHNVAGDLQPVSLNEDYKNDLSKITRSLTVSDFIDGSYETVLSPWVDLSKVSQAQAFDVLKTMINLQNAGIFNAEIFTPTSVSEILVLKNASGFRGQSTTTQSQILANMYLLTDRQGYTLGYGLQWRGKPDESTSELAYLTLIRKYAPTKMTGQAQKTWIDPLSKALSSAQPFRFSLNSNSNEDLKIFQGKLLDNYVIVSTDTLYKRAMNTDTVDTSVYGNWTQQVGTETFNGKIDLAKIYPISYLDKDVFKTSKNVTSGQYIFPLYATLTFKFNDTSVPDVKLGIVIDENGDIRTDIGPNATTTDMSGTCGTLVNGMQDNNGITQYRVGTTGAANSTSSDQSITIRMILSDAKFGLLEGALLGLNQNLSVSTDAANAVLSSGGVKINLGNLLNTNSNSRSISVSNFNDPSSGLSTVANWANTYAAYQKIYNSITNIQPAPTADQIELAKRVSGTLTAELPNCYSVKNK